MNYFENLFSLLKKYWKYQLILIAIVAIILIINVLKMSRYDPIGIGIVYLKNEYNFENDIGYIYDVGWVNFYGNPKRKTVKDSLYGKLYYEVDGEMEDKIVEIEFIRENTNETWQISNVEVLD